MGAGFSAVLGMPGWAKLLENLVGLMDGSSNEELVARCRDCIENGEYTIVSSLLHREIGSADIHEHVAQAFGDQNYHAASKDLRGRAETRMRHLVLGPWAGFITTNYDNLIEIALNKWGVADVTSLSDFQRRLGAILSEGSGASRFFVKIHGSLNSSEIILSSEEYAHAYLSSRKIINFLNAVMMRYHLFFIGCSLEDQILAIRQQLVSDFQGHIPIAYALVPASKRNLRRAEWLKSSARVDSIFYEEDAQHLGVDEFLEKTYLLALEAEAELSNLGQKHRKLRKLPSKAQWEELGEINRDILSSIHRSRSVASRSDILELSSSTNWGRSASQITPGERMYRILFLVETGLLREEATNSGAVYILSTPIQELLDEMVVKSPLADRAQRT